MLSLQQISVACKAQWKPLSDNISIVFICTDTRKIQDRSQTLFVAIKTDRRNGHDYIADAYQKGLRYFLVSEACEYASYPNASFLQVEDTVLALQVIATTVRNQFNIPVIGITGSNGKTSIKEWLNQLLQPRFNIVRSPKSYNSQIGVPLSVWQMNAEHQLGIFEAGISQPGEMERLEKIIQPTIGVFTNIGEAHREGFLDTRQKINEKLQLFRHAKTLIYCRDYSELDDCVLHYVHQQKGFSDSVLNLFSWSYKHDADLMLKEIDKQPNSAHITAVYKGESFRFFIPFSDAASIENAINCCCVLLLFNTPIAAIEVGMSELKPIAMRMELRQGDNNCSIINDSYNSDLTSLHVALDFLEQQKQQPNKTLILSDLQQAGKSDFELYKEVAEIVARRNIHRFIGIGKVLLQYKDSFLLNKKMSCYFFKTTEEFIQNIQRFSFDNEAILLKGSRSFTFEKISILLEQKIHQTVMSINLSTMLQNLEVFRSRLNPNVKTMAMVKASSYGSGGYEVANALQDASIDYLTVAYPDEGVALRKAGTTLPIMVMSPSTISFDRMILWRLEPEIFNLRSLNQFIAIAKKLGVKNYPIHIKLDTGMHRLGFMEPEISILLSTLNDCEEVHIASIFSHLAASDDSALDYFTAQQGTAFCRMSDIIIESLGYRPLRHLCNTAGIVLHPEYHFDMVRLGLGLYGIDSTNTLNNQLQQISTLKTTIAQIKNIPAGDTIGYSRKGKVTHDMRIATICIGYADGYPRAMSNGETFVMINNQPAKLIGAIAMDMCMVDITNIEGVSEGDEVIVFGAQLSINQLAKWAGTIAYEIMTGISQRVKRVYVNEGN
jgi:Alr-MurF fusion protein